MIKIYLLDFSGADSEIISRSALPLYVGKTKNEKLKIQRIIAHSLLSYAFEESFSRPLPPIERDENGRPFIPSDDIDFNISHDGNVVALIISDKERVGIDIQITSSEVSKRLIEKADSLYKKVSALTIRWEKMREEVQIKTLAAFCDNGILSFKACDLSLAEYSETNGKSFDLFSHWSLIEAVSKADGEGLSGINKLSEKNKKFLVNSGYITDKQGRLYSFTASKKI